MARADAELALRPASATWSDHLLRTDVAEGNGLSIFGMEYDDVERGYRLGPVLGRGVMGVVRRCVSVRTGEVFACKTLSKRRMTYVADVEDVRAEVAALSAVSGHPAVAAVEDVVEDEESVHIIMEFCQGGNLLDRIKQRRRFSERCAAQACRALLSAVRHCHARGVMHRDLKPENVLLTSLHSDSAIKVADFGQAVFFSPRQKLTQAVGTPYYVAPEVLSHSYGPEADIWSVGVILYMLLCGIPPFRAKSRQAIFAKIKEGVYDLKVGPWRHISDAAKDLVQRMLSLDPAERITAQDAHEHPWLQQQCESHYQTAFQPFYKSASWDSLAEFDRFPTENMHSIDGTFVNTDRSMSDEHCTQWHISQDLTRSTSNASLFGHARSSSSSAYGSSAVVNIISTAADFTPTRKATHSCYKSLHESQEKCRAAYSPHIPQMSSPPCKSPPHITFPFHSSHRRLLFRLKSGRTLPAQPMHTGIRQSR